MGQGLTPPGLQLSLIDPICSGILAAARVDVPLCTSAAYQPPRGPHNRALATPEPQQCRSPAARLACGQGCPSRACHVCATRGLPCSPPRLHGAQLGFLTCSGYTRGLDLCETKSYKHSLLNKTQVLDMYVPHCNANTHRGMGLEVLTQCSELEGGKNS